jgi:hypothetical protein
MFHKIYVYIYIIYIYILRNLNIIQKSIRKMKSSFCYMATCMYAKRVNVYSFTQKMADCVHAQHVRMHICICISARTHTHTCWILHTFEVYTDVAICCTSNFRQIHVCVYTYKWKSSHVAVCCTYNLRHIYVCTHLQIKNLQTWRVLKNAALHCTYNFRHLHMCINMEIFRRIGLA